MVLLISPPIIIYSIGKYKEESMITSIYLRLVFGLITTLAVGSSIAVTDQISDEALIALAKQKQDKIKATDYIEFVDKFLDSTKDIFIKERIIWYQGKGKEELREYKKSNPKQQAENDWEKEKSQFKDKNKMIKFITRAGLPKIIEIDIMYFFEPRKSLFRQKLKQWLDKY